MPTSKLSKWTDLSTSQRQLKLGSASQEDLRMLARTLSWAPDTLQNLGWIAAQSRLDLNSATVLFFNGDPHRFNYELKDQVPEESRAHAALLDNICMRINSGFYLFDADADKSVLPELKRWLRVQRSDRISARVGRWQLDDAAMAPLVSDYVTRPHVAVRRQGVVAQSREARRDLLPELRDADGDRQIGRASPGGGDANLFKSMLRGVFG